jgi:hypothetical protein
MAVRKIPIDIKGLKFVEQVSWAGGDPGAGYESLRAFDIKFDATKNMIVPGYQKPESCRGPDKAIGAGRGGTLTFKTYLRGGAGAESDFTKLAKYCGMTVKNNPDDLAEVVAGSAVGTLVVDANPTGYDVGDCVCCYDAVNTVCQLRFASSVDHNNPVGDSTITIEPNWIDIPTATDDLYSTDTLTPALGEPAKYICFQAYSGQGATDRMLWTLTGCAGTFKIAATSADALPVVEWSYMVDNWVATEASTTQAADTYQPAHPLLGDPFYIGNTATKITSFGFDPGIKLAPYTATEGVQGRAGWLYHGTEPTLEFMPYHDIDWINTYWELDATFQVMLESVKDADEAWAIYIPAVQVLKVSEEDAGNSHAGSKMEFLITDPGTGLEDAAVVNIPLYAIGVTGA